MTMPFGRFFWSMRRSNSSSCTSLSTWRNQNAVESERKNRKMSVCLLQSFLRMKLEYLGMRLMVCSFSRVGGKRKRLPSWMLWFFDCALDKQVEKIASHLLSNVEKITSTILPLASNILFSPLPFRLFSNLFSVTMLALLLRISSKIAQKCRCKIAELILSTLLKIRFDIPAIFGTPS